MLDCGKKKQTILGEDSGILVLICNNSYSIEFVHLKITTVSMFLFLLISSCFQDWLAWGPWGLLASSHHPDNFEVVVLHTYWPMIQAQNLRNLQWQPCLHCVPFQISLVFSQNSHSSPGINLFMFTKYPPCCHILLDYINGGVTIWLRVTGTLLPSPVLMYGHWTLLPSHVPMYEHRTLLPLPVLMYAQLHVLLLLSWPPRSLNLTFTICC